MKRVLKGKACLCVLKDARGDIRQVVADESGDKICIYGYSKNGSFQQYDSYEAWHAYDWAKMHGMEFSILNFEYEVDYNDKVKESA